MSPTSPANARPAPTRRLTTAQALVAFLARQYTERDGRRHRLISATWGIFGHGNVAGIGQALVEAGNGNRTAHRMPYLQGRNEQAMVHAAVGYARQSGRLSAHAVTTSIGPGATNLVTGAALATINHLPVLLLPGDTFAARPADPVLQQLEVPYAGDVSVNDCLRPVSRYFDRVSRPEALIPAALQAMRVLADPAETGAVTLALPQDVQAEAYDWPEEFFAERVWRVRRQAPDVAELEAAVRAVRSARRPLIVAGGGVRHSGAEENLAAFTAATRIPVASTQAGKGALRHDHPADVGSIGHTGTATADELARTADLVIGIGTRYTDFTTASGTLFENPAVRFLNLNITGSDAHKLAALPWSPTPAPAWRRSRARSPDGRTGSTRRTRRSTPVRRRRGRNGSKRPSPPPTSPRAPPRRRSSACSTHWSPRTTSSSTPPARSPATCTDSGAPAPATSTTSSTATPVWATRSRPRSASCSRPGTTSGPAPSGPSSATART